MAEPEELESEVLDNEVAEIPEEAVVAEEGEETPQSSEEAEEFELDLGSDEQESQKKTVPLYKLNKLRKRAQKAEAEVGNASQENEALRAELESLRGAVAKVTAGPRPDPFDFDTQDEFYVALDKYNESAKAPVAARSAAQPAAQHQAFTADESFFESHYDRASKLPLKSGEYESAEKGFRDSLIAEFGDHGNDVADYILQEAGDKSDVVGLALGKNESEQQKLISALTKDAKDGGIRHKKFVWKLSEKATLKRKTNRVTTEPVEAPKGKGNADALSVKIADSLKKWRENPTLANAKKLRTLRNSANG